MEIIDVQRSFTRNDVRIIAAGSFVLGAAGGVLVTRHVLTKKYLAIINFEVEEVRDSYAKRYKEGEYATPESAAKALIQQYEGSDDWRTGNDVALPETVEIDGKEHVSEDGVTFEPVDDGGAAIAATGISSQRVVPVQTNVFSDGNFRARQDEAMEIGTVINPDRPYEIAVDEFFQENPHYEKLTVKYYEGDDTLADDRESPVPDAAVDEVIGAENLDKFGLRSGDPNIVYVRNDKISADYEVIRDARSYAVVVAGVNPADLEPPQVRKMRRSDVERDD